MSLQPINQEQVQQTAQIVLTYLDDPENRTPNNMLEGIVSGKSLLRGILAGQLFVCAKTEDARGEEDEDDDNDNNAGDEAPEA